MWCHASNLTFDFIPVVHDLPELILSLRKVSISDLDCTTGCFDSVNVRLQGSVVDAYELVDKHLNRRDLTVNSFSICGIRIRAERESI